MRDFAAAIIALAVWLAVAAALAGLALYAVNRLTTQTGNFRITVYHPGGGQDVYDASRYQPLDGRANVWCRDGRELVVRGDFTVEEIK